MKPNTNIAEATEKVLGIIERTWDDVVSVTFIYIPGSDNTTVKGLNIQLFGHALVIVPDINKDDYFMYYTKTDADRRHIASDLTQVRGYSYTQAAKMMKCSPGTITHLLDENKK